MKTLVTLFQIAFILVFIGQQSLRAQEGLSLEKYLELVKMNHPFVKQAQLKIDASEANLMKSRGAFDPKLNFNQKEKNFKGINYYKNQKTQLIVPTYFGIQLDAQVQESSGFYLNPENNTDGQLYGIGGSIDLSQGILSNPRQIALKQAKLFTKQAKERNALEVNEILTAASHAYLDWYKAYKSYQIIEQFVSNAFFRFEGVKKRVNTGDLAAIDSTEARIAYFQRQIERENAQLDYQKNKIEVSNFIWFESQPFVLSNEIEPELNEEDFVMLFKADSLEIENHPKLLEIGFKRSQLDLEKRLQKSNLLPQLSLHYQWLSDSNPISKLNYTMDPDNNITGIKASFPLFLRKERANLKLASIKVIDMEWEQAQTKVELENKIKALYLAKERLKNQWDIAKQMVEDYRLLLIGEQKKFAAGESSLFLVNSRESKLIEALLKSISLEVNQKKAEINYYYAINFQSNPMS